MRDALLITTVEERGKRKCCKYWGQPVTIGDANYTPSNLFSTSNIKLQRLA